MYKSLWLASVAEETFSCNGSLELVGLSRLAVYAFAAEAPTPRLQDAAVCSKLVEVRKTQKNKNKTLNGTITSGFQSVTAPYRPPRPPFGCRAPHGISEGVRGTSQRSIAARITSQHECGCTRSCHPAAHYVKTQSRKTIWFCPLSSAVVPCTLWTLETRK